MPAAPCSFCGSTEGPDHICPGQNLQLIGQVLDGRYRIDDVLGQGGMGMVFRATQTSVQRPVAVKTLHPTLAAAPQFFERFKREAEMASRLRHPNIITIYDFGRTPDGTCYYVMELLEGESLKQAVKREGPMSIARAVEVVLQSARALGHAHEQGVIHRDIKPHNIMVQRLDQRDFVKVLDFGLVKAMEQDENQQLTSTGQVLGTPQYMPPEQAGGELVDHRSDLYSLAGVLYFCLTGGSPFGANTVRKALQAALTQTVAPVGKKRLGAPVPTELDELLRKALAREKEDRHQSAEEFISELNAAIAHLSPQELEAMPAAGDAAQSARDGSGSGSGARERGTVASRKGTGSSKPARGSTPSNVIVDSQLQGGRAPSRAGSGASRAGSASSASSARPPPPPPDALPPQRSRGSSKAGLFVAVPVVLAALAVGGFLAFSGDDGPAPRPVAVERVAMDPQPTNDPQPVAVTPTNTPEAPSEISVRFESEPSGAGVYEGEVQIGTTPVELRMPKDRAQTLTFKLSGHQPVARPLDFSRLAEERTTVRVALKKVEPRPVVQPASGSGKKKTEESVPVFE